MNGKPPQSTPQSTPSSTQQESSTPSSTPSPTAAHKTSRKKKALEFLEEAAKDVVEEEAEKLDKGSSGSVTGS